MDLSFAKKLTPFLFIPAKWARTQNPAVKSLTMGIVNGFIPCGWLYVFVLGSIATKEALYGAILLAIFWLGTVPALSAFATIYKTFSHKFPAKLNQIAGIILVLVGLVNMTILVANRLMPTINSAHHIFLNAL